MGAEHLHDIAAVDGLIGDAGVGGDQAEFFFGDQNEGRIGVAFGSESFGEPAEVVFGGDYGTAEVADEKFLLDGNGTGGAVEGSEVPFVSAFDAFFGSTKGLALSAKDTHVVVSDKGTGGSEAVSVVDDFDGVGGADLGAGAAADAMFFVETSLAAIGRGSRSGFGRKPGGVSGAEDGFYGFAKFTQFGFFHDEELPGVFFNFSYSSQVEPCQSLTP